MSDPMSLENARRRATMAAILGLDATTIRVEEVASQLMQEGVIVDVSLSRWRARASLDLDDLGLPPLAEDEAESIRSIFRLGEKRLLPEHYFKRLAACEKVLYRTLERYSFPSPWGRFVPATAFPAWKQAHAQAEAEYLTLRDEIVADHPRILGLLREQYTVAARRAYRVIHQMAGVLDAERLGDQEAFVSATWARIRASVPPAAEIGASFTMDVAYTLIPLPTVLAKGDAITASVAGLRSRVSIASEAEAQRRRLIEDMNREVVAQARAKKEALIDGFLTGLVGQLRGLIYQVATDTLRAVEGKPALHNRSLASVKELIGKVERLNFFGDAEATAMMAQVQGLLDQAPTDRSPEAISRVLRAVSTVARSSLIAIGEEPRSAREVGVSDAPSGTEIRAARVDLGLIVGDDAATEATPRRGRRMDEMSAIPAPDADRRVRRVM